ncbi:hypothetical protein CPC08DRAFT_824666 [Agrocybe pediades]|nr:hypothetical protein CPC08DRAFT_824666 [Agrocybe pediades]
MVAYVTGTSTAKLRGFDDYERGVSPEDKKHFCDRYFHRVTLKDGGKPLVQFSSPEEVLYAIRDAIRGHKNLWDRGVLHRDIGINNILITHSDTVPHGGTLIDLDMAVWIDRANSPEAKDFRAGTQAFQSVSILSRSLEEIISIPPHDHLDDFESVLYVLCIVAMGFEGPGKKATPICKDIHQWLDLNPTTARNSKFVFILAHSLPTAHPFFGPIFDRLIRALIEFLRPHVRRKWRAHSETKFPALECLKESAQNDYMVVLGLFDKAIADLEADNGFKKRNKTVDKPLRRSSRIRVRMMASPYSMARVARQQEKEQKGTSRKK